MDKMQLSKLPYKGTKDIFPEDMMNRNYLFDTWSRVAKRFGYEEYDTPLIEDANLYKVKSGEDIANNQLYSFVDKGDRKIALRPEMTPSLARMITSRKNELIFPLRWFNIGRYYRYEKPQKGRSREFFQLNIDILGVSEIEAEIEILQYVLSVMKELEAPKETFEIRISNRYLLDYLFDNILKLKEELKPKVSRAIDVYSKLKDGEFKSYLKEIGLNQDQTKKLLNYLTWELKDLRKIEALSQGAKELLKLFEKANSLKLSNLKFSPYIVRGLQYYTGTVLEMYDVGNKENIRALFGGGRYDNLLEIFNEKKIPAFGLGWGDITMLNYLKDYNLLPKGKTSIKVFVTLMETSLYEQTAKIVDFLRNNGINTQMQLSATKLAKQIKYANKKSIPWVIIVGENEIKTKTVMLKNMSSSKQYNITLEEVIKKIR